MITRVEMMLESNIPRGSLGGLGWGYYSDRLNIGYCCFNTSSIGLLVTTNFLPRVK